MEVLLSGTQMTFRKNLFHPPKQNFIWSQEEINKALEDSFRIQALKDNPNPMHDISPLFREGILKDVDLVPFMYYDIPSDDFEQLDLPLSPFSKFYIMFTHLHPNDNLKVTIRTERERLKTFYTQNALPLKEVWTRKKITKISGYGRKVLTKFELNCPLF